MKFSLWRGIFDIHITWIAYSDPQGQSRNKCYLHSDLFLFIIYTSKNETATCFASLLLLVCSLCFNLHELWTIWVGLRVQQTFIPCYLFKSQIVMAFYAVQIVMLECATCSILASIHCITLQYITQYSSSHSSWEIIRAICNLHRIDGLYQPIQRHCVRWVEFN